MFLLRSQCSTVNITGVVPGLFLTVESKLRKNLIHSNENQLSLYLPPANQVCEGYVFTGVCLSTGGCLPHTHPGPEADPPRQAPPSPRQTPPCPVHAGIHTPTQCMLGYTHPPAQCMLGYDQQAGGTHPTEIVGCETFIRWLVGARTNVSGH